ncbi:MAG: flagellar protein FliS [Betaproteobacteria bacterium]|nr:flagellar protein FliS [Betaproteobacteria bacterium]NBT06049.1 flagellar protein FliS [Betaproteobacteria bacterium]NDE54419.1 flagellar protein FliS [Actinomycetota bacterium]
MRGINAYRNVDSHTSVLAAKQLDLVVLAYDALIARLLEAQEALRSGDIALRGEKVSRALDIIDRGLVGALDLNQGGDIAQALKGHYDRWGLLLLRFNLTVDESIMASVLEDVRTLRSGWDELRRMQAAASAVAQ